MEFNNILNRANLNSLEVYFEIGLITGAKIAFQFAKRTEELS